MPRCLVKGNTIIVQLQIAVAVSGIIVVMDNLSHGFPLGAQGSQTVFFGFRHYLCGPI